MRQVFEPVSGSEVSRETPPPESMPDQLKAKGIAIGELVSKKNKAYGNSVDTSSKAFALLFPDGIPPEKYVQALLLVRVWDKMMRIATHEGAFKEDPFEDIAGYGLLGTVLGANRKAP